MSIHNVKNNAIVYTVIPQPPAAIISLIYTDPTVSAYLSRGGSTFSALNALERLSLYSFYSELKCKPTENVDPETNDTRNHRPMIDLNKFVFNRQKPIGTFNKLLTITGGAVTGVSNTLAQQTSEGVLASACVEIAMWHLREQMLPIPTTFTGATGFKEIHTALAMVFQNHGFLPAWTNTVPSITPFCSFLEIINPDSIYLDEGMTRGREQSLEFAIGNPIASTMSGATTAAKATALVNLMSDVNKVLVEFIKQDAQRFYRVFLGYDLASFDDVRILGAGGIQPGSRTMGLLDLRPQPNGHSAGALFFQYNCLATPRSPFIFQPQNSSTEQFLAILAGDEAVIHFAANGFEGTPDPNSLVTQGSVRPIFTIMGVNCCFDRVNNTNKKSLFQPIIITSATARAIPGVTIPPINQAFFNPAPLNPNNWALRDPSTGATVAIFNQSTSEITYTSDGSPVSIFYGSEWEETFLIATLISRIVDRVNFNLNSFFDSDKFEIKNNYKLQLETYLINQDAGHGDSIYTSIGVNVNDPYFAPLTITLCGRFVGKVSGSSPTTLSAVENRPNGASRVVSDSRYWFLNPDLITPGNPPIENTGRTPELQGSGGANLRTSFVKMTSSKNKIEIFVDSYVSPYQSYLNTVVGTTDYRITSSDIDSTYRSGLSGRATIINTKTLTNTYPAAFYTADGTNPSYNPVLASLRSIGVFEAIVDVFLKNSSYSYLMCDQLLNQLSQAVVPTDLVYGTDANISYQEFSYWRWYESRNVLRVGTPTTADYYYHDADQLLIVAPSTEKVNTPFDVFLIAINSTDGFIDRQFNGTIVLTESPSGSSNLSSSPVNITNGVGKVTLQCTSTVTFTISSNTSSLTKIDVNSNITSFPSSGSIVIST